MVWNYQKKTTKGQYNTDSMKQAVQYVRDGGKCAEAARRFGVNRETVRSIKGAYLMFLLLAFTHTKCNTPTLITYLLVFNIIPTIYYTYSCSFCVIFCLFTLSSKNKRKLWKNYQHLYITYLFSLRNKGFISCTLYPTHLHIVPQGWGTMCKLTFFNWTEMTHLA